MAFDGILEENNICRIVKGDPMLLLKDGLERGFFLNRGGSFMQLRGFHSPKLMSHNILFRGCMCLLSRFDCMLALGSGLCVSCMKKAWIG